MLILVDVVDANAVTFVFVVAKLVFVAAIDVFVDAKLDATVLFVVTKDADVAVIFAFDVAIDAFTLPIT